MAESLGLDDVAHYWRQVNVMNERQCDRFSRKIIDRFEGNLVGRKLAMLGFAFKKNTGDTRESLAVDVIRVLLEERPAEIAIFDPYCRQEDILRELELVCPGVAEGGTVKIHTDPYMACSQAHAVLVVTDCDQFRNTPRKPSPRAVSPTEKGLARSTAEDCHGNVKRACARQERETWTHAGVSYQLTPQSCGPDCADCRSISRPTTEAVEWTRIAYNMVEPKWVFDGRGLLDPAELAKLGVRADTVGRRNALDVLA
jgi:UDPglucose 6-dehydrogenase